MAGYLGFVAFVESERTIGAGILILAAATGFAAFFSPCSFPLLMTLLSRKANESKQAALVSGLRVGADAAGFLALVAAVIIIRGEAVAGVVGFNRTAGRWFRLVIGSPLILLGLRQMGLLRLRKHWLNRVAGIAGSISNPSRLSGHGRDVA